MIRYLSVGVLFVFLSACTSQEDKFKDLAFKLAEKERLALLFKEADGALRHSDVLFEGYIKAMLQKSEIKAKEVKILGADSAIAQVEIGLPSAAARQTLLGIASRVDLTKSRRFNFSEAMGLLKKQGAIKSLEVNDQILKVYRFKRTAKGWTVLRGNN